MTTDDRFDAAARKLVGQIAHWTPSRWTASSASGQSRAELVHELVQWLADRSAEAEGRAPGPVRRLANDLALTDQLSVLASDLARFAPAELVAATARINAVRAALS